jgi:nucleoside-diphosphate-sugar epimerase
LKGKGTLLITGGLGFLGSWTVEEAVRRGYRVLVVDALTYAANPENLSSLRAKFVVPSVRHFWGMVRVEGEKVEALGDPPPTGEYATVRDLEREVEGFLSSDLDVLVILASVEDYPLMKSLMAHVEGVVHLAGVIDAELDHGARAPGP